MADGFISGFWVRLYNQTGCELCSRFVPDGENAAEACAIEAKYLISSVPGLYPGDTLVIEHGQTEN